MFCDNCGQENPDGTRFCASCGHAMDGSAPTPTSSGARAHTPMGGVTTSALRSHVTKSSKSILGALFSGFDVMVVPKIITIIYVLMIAAVLIGGLFGFISSLGMMTQGGGTAAFGLLSLICTAVFTVIGALISRIFCELAVVQFKIHEALQDIRTQTARQ
ncbi:DUF4282 domain-containing protein [Thermomonas sp.]|mgnify:FL=1|uniref:DUF4282 domain-containing protein n=1 Tax=Thermomonas sp. TaxID=1971895 RepID=UPI001B4FDC73|nr:DUF4282 domain-containing protein [Thermomonas sp.]MBL0228981.1 DUF4282 domain-containing protein [Thermomonas sp.]MBP8647666.1 DUF4282 domain-containing protein [Thermomonas sp.]